MKTINIRHEIFIREMIAHGNRIKACGVATVSQLLTAMDLDTKLENLMQIIDSESLRRSPALKSD